MPRVANRLQVIRNYYWARSRETSGYDFFFPFDKFHIQKQWSITLSNTAVDVSKIHTRVVIRLVEYRSIVHAFYTILFSRFLCGLDFFFSKLTTKRLNYSS